MSDSCRDRISERRNMPETFLYRCNARHLHQLELVSQKHGMTRAEYIRAMIDRDYRSLIQAGVIDDWVKK